MSQPVLVGTASRMREIVKSWRTTHQTVALVPTMGNLHEGHLSLAELGREHADRVVMSIFVNPTQFGAGEDFESYPRTLDEDRAKVVEAGCVDVLFVPEIAEIYPFGTAEAVRVTMPEISRELCGASRPGHFDGVISVVCRLLNIVTPDSVVLGRKDYQQLILIERMIADLGLAVEVVSGPTLRHSDGLAISSRNRYLTAEQRAHASVLHATLEQVKNALKVGASDYPALQEEAMNALRAEGFEPDYVEVRQAIDLTKPNGTQAPDNLIVVAAAWLGRARLIDNLHV